MNRPINKQTENQEKQKNENNQFFYESQDILRSPRTSIYPQIINPSLQALLLNKLQSQPIYNQLYKLSQHLSPTETPFLKSKFSSYFLHIKIFTANQTKNLDMQYIEDLENQEAITFAEKYLMLFKK